MISSECTCKLLIVIDSVKNVEAYPLILSLLIHSFQNSSDSNKRVLYSLISIKYKGSDEAVLKSYTKFITMAASHLDIDISDL